MEYNVYIIKGEKAFYKVSPKDIDMDTDWRFCRVVEKVKTGKKKIETIKREKAVHIGIYNGPFPFNEKHFIPNEA